MKVTSHFLFLLIVLFVLSGCLPDQKYDEAKKYPIKNEHSYHKHEEGDKHDHSHDNPKHTHNSNPLHSATGHNDSVKSSNTSDDELFKDKNRHVWQKPKVILDKMGNLRDKTVGDLGAGPIGYFSVIIAQRAKKVIALDIDAEAISFIDSLKVQLPKSYQDRIETRLVKTDDAKLNANEVDKILIVNTYTYIENRVDYLRKLRKGLTPNGEIILVDFKKKLLPPGFPDSASKIPLFQVEEELLKAGFDIMESDDRSLDYQYIIVARVNEDS